MTPTYNTYDLFEDTPKDKYANGYYGLVKYQGIFFIQFFNKEILDELYEKFGLDIATGTTTVLAPTYAQPDKNMFYNPRNNTHGLKKVGYHILEYAATEKEITKKLNIVLSYYKFLEGIEDFAEYHFDTYPEHLV